MGETLEKYHILSGERVKKIRTRHNWTQDKLSEALGIAQGTLSMIERGVRSLTEENARKIVDLFPGINIAWLLGYEAFETEAEAEVGRLIYPTFKKIFEKNTRIRAVQSLFDTIDLSFELNSSSAAVKEYREMTTDQFFNLPVEKQQQAFESILSCLEHSTEYLIKKDDQIVGYCSEIEKKALYEEIFSFVEFKINQLCVKGDVQVG